MKAGVKASATVTDRDNGYAETLRRIDEAAAGLAITVGVHADAGEQVEVAERHEYGIGVPARPFVSGWADANREEAQRKINEALQKAIAQKVSPIQMLDVLAQQFAGGVQSYMAAGIPPEKKDGSVARLIDTGQLRSSVAGKVGER